MKAFYVAPSGNDSNDGSFSAPFQRIDKASHVAAAGDTVHITAGTYHETVSPQVDGVTYNGERGLNGEWLTIVDPSKLVTGTWKKAPEVGANVWKLELGYQPGIFIYNGQCIECVGHRFPGGPLVPPGLALLAQPNPTHVPSGALTDPTTGALFEVNFWNGCYALAAYDNDTATESSNKGSGITYIRFANNADPNTLTLWAASGSPGWAPWTYGIDNYGMSKTTITNLAIRGAYAGIRIADGHDNTVVSAAIYARLGAK